MLRKQIEKMISSGRSIPVAGKYAEMGGRSPIRLVTERQGVRLVAALSPYIETVAVTAMRYWHPMSAEAADALRKAGPLDDIVLLPLYPHFSYATTLSSLKEWRRVYGPADGRAEEHTVGQIYDHPQYIQAVTPRIGSMQGQIPARSAIDLGSRPEGLA